MKTQTKPKPINARSTRLASNRVLDSPSRHEASRHEASRHSSSGLGFASRLQTSAFALCCLTLLVSPYLFSGFWPVTHDYGTQSFFSVLAACAALLLALSPRDETLNGQAETLKTKRADLSLPTKLLIAFFAWCALSCVASVYLHDTILEISRVGTAMSWFLILRELLRCGTAQTTNRVLDMRALCLMLAAVCGLAIVCVRALDNFRVTHDVRQFGTFANTNWFANACAMTLPLALGATFIAWRRARRERPQLTPFVVSIGAILSLLILGGLIVTSSKGGFLAAIVALFVFAVGLWRAQNANLKTMWRAHRVLIAIAVIVVVVIGGALAQKTVLPRLRQAGGTDDNSTMFRVYTWKSTLQMAQARPVLGWGPGGFSVAHDQFAIVGTTKSAHQSWLQIAAENGFPAMILLAAATIAFLVRGWRALKTAHWPQSLGALCAVVAFAVHGLTDAGWSVTSVVLILMLTFALLDSSDERNANIEYSKSPARETSRLRWSWLCVVALAGAFSYAAQQAANGEDARDKSYGAQRSGDAPLAFSLGQEATEIDSLSSRVWLRFAQTRYMDSDSATSFAEAAFAQASELNPHNSVVWRSWAESREEMPQSSTRSPLTATLWDNAVRCAPRDSSTLLARAKWRLKQNPNDVQAWKDLENVVRERDAPYGRYAAIGDYVNLDFARASALLVSHIVKSDPKRAQTLLKNALSDVALAENKVAHQKEVAAANSDSEGNLGPPKDLDELRNQLKLLQASE